MLSLDSLLCKNLVDITWNSLPKNNSIYDSPYPSQNSKPKGSHSDGFTYSFSASSLPGSFEEVSHFIQMLSVSSQRGFLLLWTPRLSLQSSIHYKLEIAEGGKKITLKKLLVQELTVLYQHFFSLGLYKKLKSPDNLTRTSVTETVSASLSAEVSQRLGLSISRALGKRKKQELY